MSAMPDEPTCRLITVPVSAGASMIGFQYSSKMDGKADPVWSFGGGRPNGPAFCVPAWISTAPAARVNKKGDPQGNDAVGVRGNTTRRTTSRSRPGWSPSPSSGSLAVEKTRPQNPVIWEGKLSEAHTPLMSMSRIRASMSKQPGRIWSKRKGSTATAPRPPSGHRVHPHLGVVRPSNSTLVALGASRPPWAPGPAAGPGGGPRTYRGARPGGRRH